MICFVFKIKDPLNYDVIFPDGMSQCVSTAKSGDIAKIVRVSPTNYQASAEESHSLYRLKIRGVERRERRSCGNIQYEMVRWNDRNGGVFMCKPYEVDAHGRILCDLVDPVTEQSVSQWLLGIYSTHYLKK
jgi:hypothetical protein